MVNRIKKKKKLLQLGTLSVALMIGTVSLGCSKAVEAEETKETASIVVAEAAETATPTVEATATPSPTPTNTPAPTPTPEPTAEPSPTPYDPYTLSDEEAIKMGKYIYRYYVNPYKVINCFDVWRKYQKTHPDSSGWPNYASTFFGMDSEHYQIEDIVNYVCLLNQRYPTVYPDRSSSLERRDLIYLNSMYECFLNGDGYKCCLSEYPHLFPYSLFMKEGRPEKSLLQELEEQFVYIASAQATDEEQYEYWGKVINLCINYEETLIDWNVFNYEMLYYTLKNQYYYWMQVGKPLTIPAEYVFKGRKNASIRLYDAFDKWSDYKSKNRGLSSKELDSYQYCIGQLQGKYLETYFKLEGVYDGTQVYTNKFSDEGWALFLNGDLERGME